MRWNRVKKTAQWAVFSDSLEGFSPRGRAPAKRARESLHLHQENLTGPGDSRACFYFSPKGFEPMRWNRVKGANRHSQPDGRDAPHIPPSICQFLSLGRHFYHCISGFGKYLRLVDALTAYSVKPRQFSSIG